MLILTISEEKPFEGAILPAGGEVGVDRLPPDLNLQFRVCRTEQIYQVSNDSFKYKENITMQFVVSSPLLPSPPIECID